MSVKKDILAAITFLATGLLFIVAQADRPSDSHISRLDDCEVAETAVAQENDVAVPEDLEINAPVSRDS